MEPWSLPKARPISRNDSPAFQRRHISVLCSAESLPATRVAMEAGSHSIWISEQLQELGHEVIVANVRELRAISHRAIHPVLWSSSLRKEIMSNCCDYPASR